MIRTSNGYRFPDPLDREPGRRGYAACKTENPAGPLNREKKISGARLDGARVRSGETLPASPEQTEPLLALQREHGSEGSAPLSAPERAAIVVRMDDGTATKADWAAYKDLLHCQAHLPA